MNRNRPGSPSFTEKLVQSVNTGQITRRDLLRLFGISAAAFAARHTTAHARRLLYDYIIVGVGAAGCALAARLLARSDARLLLIEAGGSNDRPEIRDFTQSYRLTQPDSPVDWAFQSEPQPALLDKPQAFSCGKVLGGSTSINGMVWVRGNRADYDAWAAAGCDGWSYAAVRRSLDAVSAPMAPTSELTERNALSHAIVEAAVELGHDFNADYNAQRQHGVGYTQLNVRDGVRLDAFTALLTPFLGDPRLTIMTDATVAKLELDRERAIERVVVRTGQESFGVSARREVVLCTGTVQTPHLLQLSGIGNPEDLEPYGVRVRVDLPEVGRNLHDHLISVVAKRLRVPEPASHVTAMDVNVFAGAGTPEGTPRFEVQSYYMRYGWGAYPSEAVAFGVIPLHPASRGYVRLRSADPSVAPIVEPHFLTSPDDLATQLEGYALIRELLHAPSLRAWLVEEESVPGAEVQGQSALVDAIRRYSESDFHAVGTCRMGGDAGAVVDSRLRVRGVCGLRLASAAIMPKITSGNTAAPSMMIGDHCGRIILGEG